jgi:hypothetical protein
MKNNILIIICIFLFILNCSIRKSNSEKNNQCIQAYLTTYSSEEPLHYSAGGYEFRFSCSTESNYMPECFEYFSRKPIDENYLCQIGYRKVKATCSRQNLIGVCLETQSQNEVPDGIVMIAMFSKPRADLDESRLYCSNPEIKGNFFTEYRGPNDNTNIEKQRNDALIMCLGLNN